MGLVTHDPAIISTDLDGTLLGRGKYEIGNELPKALLELAPDHHFIWVINTGRRYDQIINLVRRAQIDRYPDYIVDRETFLHRRVDGDYEPLAEWNERAQSRVEHVESVVAPHLPTWCDRLTRKYTGIKIRLDSGVPLSVQSADFAQGIAVRETLTNWTHDLPGVQIIRNGVWVAIWAAGCDKGAVLAELARRHSVPTSRIMAVGDSENDLPMLSGGIAGWPVAPGNSEKIVKEFVLDQNGFVSQRPDIDGVLEGLQRFVAGLNARL